MPNSGRCRGSRSLAPLFLLTLSLFLTQAWAVSGVLGIDLGTEYIKAVLVKPGIPLEIVLTKDSKRKELAAVAFKPAKTTSSSEQNIFPERAYGSDAQALTARFPGDVYSNLKPLLGLSPNTGIDSYHQVVSNFQSRYPGLQVQQCSGGRETVCIRSNTFTPGEEPFSVEELLAMELQNIRSNAENMAGVGNTVKDAVITVPPYLTAEQKRAVQTAAELAGLRVLAMVTDGLAVGLNYATTRTFPTITNGAEPEHHLIYDMGAGSTTATVLRFQGRTVRDVGKFNKTIQEVQVLGAGWEESLGGDALNQLILDDLVSQFAESKPMKQLGASTTEIKQDGRTMAKLWKEVERLRQVLSANTESSASFEGLYNGDVNFRYKLSRAKFETLSTGFEQRVETPIKKALEMAKMKLNDIDSIILFGGATRTPFVQKALEAIVGTADHLKTNVNSDEAAAFGAAFLAATFSPSFRVKEIRATEAAILPIEISWSSDGKERSQRILTANSLARKDKQVPFKVIEDFSFTLSQVLSTVGGGSRSMAIKKVTTNNLTASVRELTEKHGCEVVDIKTEFSIRLSAEDGLPEVSRGLVSCDVLEHKKSGVVEGVKNMFGFGAPKENQVPLNGDDDEPNVATNIDAEAFSTSNTDTKTAVSTEEAKGKNSDKDALQKEQAKKTQTIYVGVTTEEEGLPRIQTADLKRIKDRMKAFDASDKSRRLREGALNELEAFTYRVRDLIEDPAFITSSSEDLRAEIQQKASDAGEWIYGEGVDGKLEDFKNRLSELKGLVEPVLQRKSEASQRSVEVQSFREVLNQTKTMVEALLKENDSRKAQSSSRSASAASSTPTDTGTSTTAPPSTFEDGELDKLDDSPVISESPAMIPDELEDIFIFSDEEIAEVKMRYQETQTWFDGKLEAQEKLAATENPVLTVAEMKKRSQELQQAAIDMLTRQMTSSASGQGKKPKKPKSSKSSSKSKGKSKKAKKSTDDADATATMSADAGSDSTVASGSASELPKTTTKDEL